MRRHPLHDVDVGELAQVGRRVDLDGLLARPRRGVERPHGRDGDAGRVRRRLEPARVHTSPLCTGVCGGTRSAVIELPGPWPSTIAAVLVLPAERHSDLGLAVGHELHDGGVMERLDHLPHEPAGPDDRIADVDAVGSALVQCDRRGEVRRVLVLGLRRDRRQRLQERQVLQRRDLTQLVLLEALFDWAARSCPIVLCSRSFCGLQRPVVERAGEEVPDRADDVEDSLAQRRIDVVGHRLHPRRQAVGPPVEVERNERQRQDDQDDDRQRAARPPGPGHPGETGRSISAWRW